jgi:hypothetical protein
VIRLNKFRSGFTLLGLAALVAAVAYANSLAAVGFRTAANVDQRLAVVAVPGYHVQLFTSAASNPKVSNPDSVVVDGGHVFIDYQNVTAKDGSDGKSSTVIEYNMRGHELKRWDVLGHSDGMRMDPVHHVLWTTSNEDGNAAFATIDPKAGVVTTYKFPPAPHGGGYDDLYFLNGKAFVAASAPNLDANGNSLGFPAVDQITLNSSTHTVSLATVLTGNATATDAITKKPVTLNLTDPDSLSTDGQGALVLVSQGDSELITIGDPGGPKQATAVLAVGTQLDDTVFPSGMGRLLVTDGVSGNTFWISKDTPFAAGSIYTQSPNDSGVTNFVGTISPTTGFITPIAVGFTKATGMVFVPDSGANEEDSTSTAD